MILAVMALIIAVLAFGLREPGFASGKPVQHQQSRDRQHRCGVDGVAVNAAEEEVIAEQSLGVAEIGMAGGVRDVSQTGRADRQRQHQRPEQR